MSLHKVVNPGPMGWSQTYWGFSELPPNIAMQVANDYARYSAKQLEVPVEEIHAYWDFDYLDPLGEAMVMAYRDDWGANCPPKCNLHAPPNVT